MTLAQPDALARAMALFDVLIELPTAARQQRLHELARSDPPLAEALSKLLAADDDASGVLDHGVDAIAHTLLVELAEPKTAAEPTLAVGMEVASFTLLRPLGSGGMGEVWLAQRRDGSFVQEVALKLLRRGMDSDEIARRFLRERRILAELNHPHIAGFIDGGVHVDGRLYYAMEYVDGSALTVYAREHGLSVHARVQLLVMVAEAVAYAQTHLVVHRDLKPTNILIDANGQPRVLDFGIAKLLGESDADPALTSADLRLLSPAYAAPEQILGEPISTATDVYALGMMAFELLTGELPVRRSSSLLTLADQVRQERIPTPSSVLRRDVQRGEATTGITAARAVRQVAGDLDVIVLTALQQDPARRYSNAAALADDLKRWLESRPIAAQADTSGYRMRKFVARNRLAVGSASSVVLALIAGFGMALWQAGVARDQAALARSEAARAEQQTAAANESFERAQAVKGFMMQTFVNADPLKRGEGAPVTVAEAFEDAVKRVDSELASDPKLQVDVLDDFGEIRANQGRFSEARDLIGRALSLAEKTYPADHPAIAESLLNRAAIENMEGGDFAAATQDAERAVRILEAHAESEPISLANALNSLGTIYNQSGRVDEVLPLLVRSVDLWRRHGDRKSDGLAAALHNTGNALFESGRVAEAKPFAEESLAEVTRLRGENSPQLEPVLNLLSQIHYRNGDTAAVEATNARRLKLLTDVFPGAHPWTASLLIDLGHALMDSDPAKAAEHFDAAIAMYRELESPRVVTALRYRALLAGSKTGNAEAKRWFDEAVDECTKRALDHVLCDVARSNRAGVIAALGDGELALAEVEFALASLKAKDADKDNEYAQALESKALALKALGQQDAALVTQTQAIERYLSLYGEGHEELARARRNLAKLQPQ
jgi:serine/threonine-protein kinase